MICLPKIERIIQGPWLYSRATLAGRRWAGHNAVALVGVEVGPDAGEEPATTPAEAEERPEKDGPQRDPNGARSQSRNTDLLLSPLMDPKLIAARERYRTPKPAPSGELSAFSKKLRTNPYAQALATPVRQCRFTGLRLPEYFHLDFGLQDHPTTGKPWHLPKFALNAEAESPGGVMRSHETAGLSEVSGRQEPSDQTLTPTAIQDQTPRRTLTGTHFVAQKSALRFISRLDKQKYPKVFPYRWKTGVSLNTRDVVWRKDMDTYVLELMRKDLLKHLEYVGSRPAGYVVGCTSNEHVKRHTQVGAALWLGAVDEVTPNASEEEVAERYVDALQGNNGPPAYAMLDYRGRYIPAYNLQTLLGEKCLEQLRESNALFRDTMAVVKQKRNTVKVQMALWKLMGYLASDV